jgi:membrane-bound ClpP family serine protease
MNKRLTRTRFILAVISTAIQETAIWAIWEKLLPRFNVNWPWQALAAVMTAWAAFSTWNFIFSTNVMKRKAEAGLPSMVGVAGEATTALAPEGQVRIKGELWQAVSGEGKIEAGEEVVVVAEKGLLLTVSRVKH